MRSRGLHVQRRYPNGEERCITYKLCEAICSATATNIGLEEHEDGTRCIKRCSIGLTKCIPCDFCKETCPTDAVVKTHIFGYHGERKGGLHTTRPVLLAIGDKYEAEIIKRKVIDALYRQRAGE